MSISAVDINNPMQVVLQNSKTARQTEAADSPAISDDYSTSSETEKFKEIVGKYNVRNMDHEELCEMSKELYDNKLISLKELGMMSFDYGRLARETGNQEIYVSGARFGSSGEKMDYLETFKKMADFKQKYDGNAQLDNQIVDLFEKIDYFQTN